jgi:hypothetical protein
MPTKPPIKAKTTLNLPEALMKQAKHRAIDEDRDLQDLVAQALAEYLARPLSRKGAA